LIVVVIHLLSAYLPLKVSRILFFTNKLLDPSFFKYGKT
jgi:hypothetical protein